MHILGISRYYHDASACLKDGKIVAAVQEERLNRGKDCADFPIKSINYCVHACEMGFDELDDHLKSRGYIPNAKLLFKEITQAPAGFWLTKQK